MYGYEILHRCGKRVKTKSQKFFGFTFVEITGEKLVGGFLLILNRVNIRPISY